MSARQAFVPRAASRAAHRHEQPPTPMPPRSASAQVGGDRPTNATSTRGSQGDRDRDGADQPFPVSRQSGLGKLFGRGGNDRKTEGAGHGHHHPKDNRDERGGHQEKNVPAESSGGGGGGNMRSHRSFEGIARPPDRSAIIIGAPPHKFRPGEFRPGSPFVTGPGSVFGPVYGLGSGTEHDPAASGGELPRNMNTKSHSSKHREISFGMPAHGLGPGPVNVHHSLGHGHGAQHNAHISTGGAISGFLRVDTHPAQVMAPTPTYLPNPSSPLVGGALERISEEAEVQHMPHHGVTQDRERTLKRSKRRIGDTSNVGGGGSLQGDGNDGSDDLEYGEPPAKRYRLDRGHSVHSGHGSHRDHAETTYERYSSPIPPRQEDPHYAGPSRDDRLLLPAVIGDVNDVMRQDEFEVLCKRWTECSREEWIAGADEITAQYQEIVDLVKEHLTSAVTQFSTLRQRLDSHGEDVRKSTERAKEITKNVVDDLTKAGQRGRST